MSDNLKSRGIKAFFWDFFGKIATYGTTFLVTIFLARLLEPSDFGLIAMITVIIAIAQVFTDVGLGAAIIQRRKVLPVHYSSVFYFNIFIGTILTLITYFSASSIAQFYNNDELIPLIQVISLSFFINAFSSLQNSKLRKELNYALLAKTNFIASLISGIIGISLALYGAGVWSLVAQILSRGIIYDIIIWFAAKWTPALLFSFKALKQLWGFGFRMFLSGLLESIFSRLDYIVIGKLFAPATLGYYERAKSLSLMINQFSSGSLMSVLFPMLSMVQNDLPRFQEIVIKAFGIISFIVFLLLGLTYLVSGELIVILFSEKWLTSVNYFKILVLSGFAYPIGALLVNVLSSRGNSKIYLRLDIVKKIVLALNLYIGFLWGIEGYLYGLVVAAIIGTSLNIFFSSREIALPAVTFVRPLVVQMSIAVITVWAVVLMTKEIETYDILLFIIKSVIFLALYFLINIIFKTNSYKYFMNEVFQILKRKKIN